MRKIVQILYDHTSKSARMLWLVLCDDGSVWRQVMVEDPYQRPASGILLIKDPTYHTEWRRVEEFDLIPNEPLDLDAINAKYRPKEWTPDDENERGR